MELNDANRTPRLDLGHIPSGARNPQWCHHNVVIILPELSSLTLGGLLTR